jgi:hypothetical protein
MWLLLACCLLPFWTSIAVTLPDSITVVSLLQVGSSVSELYFVQPPIDKKMVSTHHQQRNYLVLWCGDSILVLCLLSEFQLLVENPRNNWNQEKLYGQRTKLGNNICVHMPTFQRTGIYLVSASIRLCCLLLVLLHANYSI